MKKIILLFSVFISLLANAQDVKQLRRERIQSSYILSLGRAPSEAEITYWQGRNDANTVADFVKNHKNFLTTDGTTRRAVTTKAYRDAMGRSPIQAELDYWAKGSDTYAELMQKHMQ